MPEQPLFYDNNISNANTHDETRRYNLRKLQELPHHLNKSHRYLELFSKVLFNFEWLHAKISCMPFQSVLDDFEDVYNEKMKNKKLIKLVLDALKLSSSVVCNRPQMLGAQLIGRLIPLCLQHGTIKNLLQQCKTEGVKTNALIPLFHCYQTPGGPLETSIENHHFAPFGLCFSHDRQLMISASNKIIVRKMKNAENVHKKEIGTPGLVLCMKISPDNSRVFAFTNNSDILVFYVALGRLNILKIAFIYESFVQGFSYLIENSILNCIEDLQGMAVNAKYFVVWSLRFWFLFEQNGELIEKKEVLQKEENVNIVTILLDMNNEEKVIIVWKVGFALGVREPIQMNLDVYESHKMEPQKTFSFHSAFVASRSRKMLYACQGDFIET